MSSANYFVYYRAKLNPYYLREDFHTKTDAMMFFRAKAKTNQEPVIHTRGFHNN